MSKVKMLSGLPGSGKSTVAKALVEQGSWGRVNRDDLRAMVFNGKWTGHREGIIVEIEKAIANVLLKNNHAVVVDDTNLTEKHKQMWSGFARSGGHQFEIQKIETGLQTCILRDIKREGKSVGEAIINRMALFAGQIDFFGNPIVLVDIDGTVADGTHREGHLVGRKDWRTYYSKLSDDAPIDFVVRWVRELYKDHVVCMVSGRPDTYQHETLAWLRKHDIPFNFLFMRAGNDKREDYIVKAEILSKLPRELIQFAIDDRPQVIEKCWRANGIKVYPVRGDCEAF